jgi:hypothetical protein
LPKEASIKTKIHQKRNSNEPKTVYKRNKHQHKKYIKTEKEKKFKTPD